MTCDHHHSTSTSHLIEKTPSLPPDISMISDIFIFKCLVWSNHVPFFSGKKNPHILYVLNIVKSCLLHICKFWMVFFYHFGWSKRSISLMVNSQGLGWPRNCCHRGLGGCFAIPGPGACLAEKSVDRWVIGDKKKGIWCEDLTISVQNCWFNCLFNHPLY